MFLGVYGGRDFEGVWPEDAYDPPRYFTFHTDEALRAAVSPFFDIVRFDTFAVNRDGTDHFQALHLRRPADA
jgi:hypothetical protein